MNLEKSIVFASRVSETEVRFFTDFGLPVDATSSLPTTHLQSMLHIHVPSAKQHYLLLSEGVPPNAVNVLPSLQIWRLAIDGTVVSAELAMKWRNPIDPIKTASVLYTGIEEATETYLLTADTHLGVTVFHHQGASGFVPTIRLPLTGISELQVLPSKLLPPKIMLRNSHEVVIMKGILVGSDIEKWIHCEESELPRRDLPRAMNAVMDHVANIHAHALNHSVEESTNDHEKAQAIEQAILGFGFRSQNPSDLDSAEAKRSQRGQKEIVEADHIDRVSPPSNDTAAPMENTEHLIVTKTTSGTEATVFAHTLRSLTSDENNTKLVPMDSENYPDLSTEANIMSTIGEFVVEEMQQKASTTREPDVGESNPESKSTSFVTVESAATERTVKQVLDKSETVEIRSGPVTERISSTSRNWKTDSESEMDDNSTDLTSARIEHTGTSKSEEYTDSTSTEVFSSDPFETEGTVVGSQSNWTTDVQETVDDTTTRIMNAVKGVSEKEADQTSEATTIYRSASVLEDEVSESEETESEILTSVTFTSTESASVTDNTVIDDQTTGTQDAMENRFPANSFSTTMMKSGLSEDTTLHTKTSVSEKGIPDDNRQQTTLVSGTTETHLPFVEEDFVVTDIRKTTWIPDSAETSEESTETELSTTTTGADELSTPEDTDTTESTTPPAPVVGGMENDTLSVVLDQISTDVTFEIHHLSSSTIPSDILSRENTSPVASLSSTNSIMTGEEIDASPQIIVESPAATEAASTPIPDELEITSQGTTSRQLNEETLITEDVALSSSPSIPGSEIFQTLEQTTDTFSPSHSSSEIDAVIEEEVVPSTTRSDTVLETTQNSDAFSSSDFLSVKNLDQQSSTTSDDSLDQSSESPFDSETASFSRIIESDDPFSTTQAEEAVGGYVGTSKQKVEQKLLTTEEALGRPSYSESFSLSIADVITGEDVGTAPPLVGQNLLTASSDVPSTNMEDEQKNSATAGPVNEHQVLNQKLSTPKTDPTESSSTDPVATASLVSDVSEKQSTLQMPESMISSEFTSNDVPASSSTANERPIFPKIIEFPRQNPSDPPTAPQSHNPFFEQRKRFTRVISGDGILPPDTSDSAETPTSADQQISHRFKEHVLSTPVFKSTDGTPLFEPSLTPTALKYPEISTVSTKSTTPPLSTNPTAPPTSEPVSTIKIIGEEVGLNPPIIAGDPFDTQAGASKREQRSATRKPFNVKQSVTSGASGMLQLFPRRLWSIGRV